MVYLSNSEPWNCHFRVPYRSCSTQRSLFGKFQLLELLESISFTLEKFDFCQFWTSLRQLIEERSSLQGLNKLNSVPIKQYCIELPIKSLNHATTWQHLTKKQPTMKILTNSRNWYQCMFTAYCCQYNSFQCTLQVATTIPTYFHSLRTLNLRFLA